METIAQIYFEIMDSCANGQESESLTQEERTMINCTAHIVEALRRLCQDIYCESGCDGLEDEKISRHKQYTVHKVIEHHCFDCGKSLGDHIGHPYYLTNAGYYFCFDCALKRHFIDAEEWASVEAPVPYDHASYKDRTVTLFKRTGRGFSEYTILLDEDEDLPDVGI